jgi:hypothetical protein
MDAGMTTSSPSPGRLSLDQFLASFQLERSPPPSQVTVAALRVASKLRPRRTSSTGCIAHLKVRGIVLMVEIISIISGIAARIGVFL